MSNQKIDVSKGLQHLQHLEDFLLVAGKEGSEQALDTIQKFTNKVKNQSSDIIVSEKIDGAPSLYFGKDPDGKFFVSTKSIFAKQQKIAYSLADIQRLWSGELVNILSSAFKSLKGAFKTRGVCGQGDVLFSNKSQKSSTEYEGQQYITFQPNVIMYAIPVDSKSELFKNIRMSNFGIVVHGAYETAYGIYNRIELDRLPDTEAKKIAEDLNRDIKVFAIDPFVEDISVMKGSENEINELGELVKSISAAQDEIDPDFDQAWKDSSDPMIQKAHELLPIFVNQQVRAAGDDESIISAKDEKTFVKLFRKKLNQFISTRSEQEQGKLATSAGKERKAQAYESFRQWVSEYEQTFEPMLKVYFRLLSAKNIMVKLFNNVEKKLGKTFVVDRKGDFSIQAVKPEGYVLLNGPNMVKIVDRAEFSKNNLLYSPFNEEDESRGTTGDPESIGDKKRIYPKKPKSIADAVVEDVLDSIKSARTLCDGFSDEKLVEAADQFKKYSALFVGRFQPPTIAHVENIVRLSKLFRSVYVLMSESQNKTKKYLEKNPLRSEDRKELFESDPKLRELKNVKFAGGPSSLAFGINDEKQESEIRKLFNISDEETIVVAIGKEDDRYFEIRDRGQFFIPDHNEKPSTEKPFGLFGITLQKIPGKSEKIGASQVQKAIAQDDLDTAKEYMAGSDQQKDEAIRKIKDFMGTQDEARDEVLQSEEFLKIEDLDIRKELIDSIGHDYNVSQEEAMDLIFDILDNRKK